MNFALSLIVHKFMHKYRSNIQLISEQISLHSLLVQCHASVNEHVQSLTGLFEGSDKRKYKGVFLILYMV